jgi:cell division protease FtsH
MCSALGGRAAEELIFGKISTGALSDLEKVTKQAYAMVSIYGLNKKIGNVSFYDSHGRDSFTKPYSEETARIIDEEVSILIEAQYQRALQILSENKDKLTILAEKLLESEVIFKEDLEVIFGKRAWEPSEMSGEEFVAGLAESSEAKETRESNEAKSVAETKVEEKVDDKTEEKVESVGDENLEVSDSTENSEKTAE